MFKLIEKEYKTIIKNHDIYELWEFIVSNPKCSYQFFIGYTPISINEFLEVFLRETKNHQDYLRLYQVLKTPKSIFDYAKIS